MEMSLPVVPKELAAVGVTPQKLAQWEADREKANAAREERERIEREATETALREPVELAASYLAKNKEAASAGAEIRARRKTEIQALIAEYKLVRERDFQYRSQYAKLAIEAPEVYGQLSGYEDPTVDSLMASLQAELRGIEALERLLERSERDLEDLANRPRRRSLSTSPQALDDVMLVLGGVHGSLFIERDDAGIATEVYSSRICYVPRADWDATVKAKLDGRREEMIGNLFSSRWDHQRQATSLEHAEALAIEREAVKQQLAAEYDREHVLIVEGEDRWSPMAILEKLGRHLSEDPVSASAEASLWAAQQTEDPRTLVAWAATLKARRYSVDGALGTKLSRMQTDVRYTDKPSAAVAWWKSQSQEAE